jgi:(p)ppGpp synthase/HD superfamily hydrolase
MPETAATLPLLTGRFQRAFALASEVHATQIRKGTSIPYLAHLMSVSALVLEYGGGEDAAIGGLLHDAVEDSADGTRAEARIRREFGYRVGAIVMGCSDAVAVPGQPKPPWRQRKAAYIERLNRENDPEVLLVSACDKLHNARSIVADLRAAGMAVWDRFSENDPAEQLWYYQALADSYQGRVPPALSEAINDAVSQMRSQCDAIITG